MKAALLQMDIAWEDPERNFATIEGHARAAAAAGADLLVLPEMFGYGFSMNTSAIAEPYNGRCAQFLVSLSTSLGLCVMGSVPERSQEDPDAPPYNTLVLARPDASQERYRKIHPFTFAKEDEHYSAGTEFVTTTVAGVRLTLFVCYDLRFADEFWATADQTDAYVVVANWPAKRRQHWMTLLQARAIENQAYVLGVNRVGAGGPRGELAYSGDSAAYDPWGEPIVAATKDPTLLLCEIDPARVSSARTKFPVLADRRAPSRNDPK